MKITFLDLPQTNLVFPYNISIAFDNPTITFSDSKASLSIPEREIIPGAFFEKELILGADSGHIHLSPVNRTILSICSPDTTSLDFSNSQLTDPHLGSIAPFYLEILI